MTQTPRNNASTRFPTPEGERRERLIGVPVSPSEEAQIVAALRDAGYRTKGEGAREVLLAWVADRQRLAA